MLKDVVTPRLAPAIALLVLTLLLGCGEGPQATAGSSTSSGNWSDLPEAPKQRQAGYQEPASAQSGDTIAIVVGATYAADRMVALRYDRAEKDWASSSRSPLGWRAGYASAESEGELFVWGGASDRGELGDGAIYEVASDHWRKLSKAPLSGRIGASAVSTGRSVIVFGGSRDPFKPSNDAVAASYDLSSGSWNRLPSAPIQGRLGQQAVWSGTEMVVWGGYRRERGGVASGSFADGAAFDPQTGTWRQITKAPFKDERDSFALWTGAEMFIWNGSRAATYDPEADRWTKAPGPPLSRGLYQGVWTGDEVLIWGTAESGETAAASYEPPGRQWSSLPAGPLARGGDYVARWTGESMFLWSGCCAGGSRRVHTAEYGPRLAPEQ